MTTVSTLAAAVMTPALTGLLVGTLVPVDTLGLLTSTLQARPLWDQSPSPDPHSAAAGAPVLRAAAVFRPPRCCCRRRCPSGVTAELSAAMRGLRPAMASAGPLSSGGGAAAPRRGAVAGIRPACSLAGTWRRVPRVPCRAARRLSRSARRLRWLARRGAGDRTAVVAPRRTLRATALPTRPVRRETCTLTVRRGRWCCCQWRRARG
jgi:hypothetical protein